MPYRASELTTLKRSFSPNDDIGRPGGNNNGDTETLPLEEVSFAYGKAEWKYTQTKVQGGKGSGNVAGGWDLTKNAKL